MSFNTHKLAVLSQALAQTPLEQGGGLGVVFPLIPASAMALTHLWPCKNHSTVLLSVFFLSINPHKQCKVFWEKKKVF